MKRAERLKRLAEAHQPDVTITVTLKDMSPAARRSGAPAPPASRKDSPTPVGDPAKTIEARRYIQAVQKAETAAVRTVRCSHCRAWNELPAGEGGARCSSCGTGGL